jgi:hypothetical protein
MKALQNSQQWQAQKNEGLAMCRQIRDLARLQPFKKTVVKETALQYWNNKLRPLFDMEKAELNMPSATPVQLANLMRTDHELISRLAERIQIDGDAGEIYVHFANLTEQHLVFGSRYVF